MTPAYNIYDYLISIHTLCEEGDVLGAVTLSHRNKFQSTPSVKRVTLDIAENVLPVLAISIHTLCEEGDTLQQRVVTLTAEHFNPHPL